MKGKMEPERITLESSLVGRVLKHPNSRVSHAGRCNEQPSGEVDDGEMCHTKTSGCTAILRRVFGIGCFCFFSFHFLFFSDPR